MTFRISETLDIEALAAFYARKGRIHLPGFLTEESAQGLSARIREIPRWNLVFEALGKHYDLDAEGTSVLPAEQRERLMAIVHEQAGKGFAYLFDNCPLYDIYHHGASPDHPLMEMVEFLNSEAFLSLMRRLTGAADISFADAQATRYGPGHFLTTHDDAVDGKNRRAAFVLNMTPDWRPDWGGYLNFFGPEGHIEEAYKPTFNAINIFSVPAAHSVGLVAPFAGAKRTSITGWLRAGVDPLRR
ncbi:MAG: 2OG-Fe(II) oxygenase family protein [Pseudomonadota bacterium]